LKKRTRFLLLLFVPIFACTIVKAQFRMNSLFTEASSDEFARFGISVNNHLISEGTYQSIGIHAEFPLTEHFIALYNLRFIQADHLQATHIPLGLRLTGAILPYAADRNAFYAVLACALLPEGVGYTINPGAKIQLMPYLCPLGMDRGVRMHNSTLQTSRFKMTGSFGIRVESNLPLQLYGGFDLGANYFYAKNKLVPYAGFELGLKLRS
jgi:hypothetical protein